MSCWKKGYFQECTNNVLVLFSYNLILWPNTSKFNNPHYSLSSSIMSKIKPCSFVSTDPFFSLNTENRFHIMFIMICTNEGYPAVRELFFLIILPTFAVPTLPNSQKLITMIFGHQMVNQITLTKKKNVYNVDNSNSA